MLRRPALPALALLSLGILLGNYAPPVLCGSLLSGLGLLCVLFQKKRLLLLCAAVLAVTLAFGALASYRTPLEQQVGKEVTVFGQVASVQQRKNSTDLILDCCLFTRGGVEGKTGEKVLLSLKKTGEGLQTALAGKRIKASGYVQKPEGARNPGAFDQKRYLRTLGIRVSLSCQDGALVIIGEGNRLTSLLAVGKETFARKLSETMSETSRGLLLGMLFGEKSLLEEDLQEAFRRNGTAHILAVSGIHVGVIYLCIRKLFRGRRSVCISVFCGGLLFLYAAMASFSPSVMRALIMILLHMAAEHLHRRYDMASAAAVSAILLLLLNPYSLFRAGFQLSYLAIFTISFLFPLAESLRKRLDISPGNKLLDHIVKLLTPAFAMQAGMMAATVYLFQYVSLVAFFMNIPVIALSGVIIPMGMLLLLLSFGGGLLFDFAACGTDWLLRLLAFMNRLTASADFASVQAAAPSVGILVFFYGLLFFLSSEMFWDWFRRRKVKKCLLVFAILICLAPGAFFLTGEYRTRGDIVFLDVGQGDCIHIRTPEGKNFLIDGGGSFGYDVGQKILRPYLLKNGISKIDAAFVTHLHQDHYEGIASLCRNYPVKKLALYEGYSLREKEIMEDTGLKPEQLVYLKKGDRLFPEKDVDITVLYPEENSAEAYRAMGEEDENAMTLVLKVRYEGVSVLLTGDLGFPGEEEICRQYRDSSSENVHADILKVGHHGSRYSTGDDFLKIVNPSIAVIQVGNRNNFGHPNSEVIEKLAKKDIIVRRTDRCGAVLLNIRGKHIKMNTML